MLNVVAEKYSSTSCTTKHNIAWFVFNPFRKKTRSFVDFTNKGVTILTYDKFSMLYFVDCHCVLFGPLVVLFKF